MKKIVLMVTIGLLVAQSANAQFGPSQPRTSVDEPFSLGIGIRNTATMWTYGYDVDFSKVFVEGSMNIADGCELFGRIGGNNLVINEVELRPGWYKDLSSDGYQLFVSIGIRGLLWEYDKWSVGSSLTLSRYSEFEVENRAGVNTFQKILVRAPLEIELGMPVTWRFGECQQYSLYGGPAVHFAYIEGDTRTSTFNPGLTTIDRINALNVRDKGNVHAFVGLQGPLFTTGGRLQIEGEAGHGLGGSVSIYWSF